NMISQKGYLILLESFKNLDRETKANFELSFAGRFDSTFESDAFLKQIENEPNILYHGVVSDERKRELFHESQVFILPTMFFEGQPVSILEAYASGCVVVTTGQSGILDIFKDKINGFQINPGSIESIKEILKVIGNRKNFLELKKIAFDNLTLASKDYREETYTKRIKDALGVE
ncbi:MAG: glycosyltransferase, partial [Leptospira sp.]|nr:glycosyltransferase [Leptospira sp.]